MGGQWLIKRATKNRLKDTATAGEIMKYIIQNIEKQKAGTIILTDEEFETMQKVLFVLVDLGYDLNGLEIFEEK